MSENVVVEKGDPRMKGLPVYGIDKVNSSVSLMQTDACGRGHSRMSPVLVYLYPGH